MFLGVVELEGDGAAAALVGPDTPIAGFTIITAFLHPPAILTRLVCAHPLEGLLPETLAVLHLPEIILQLLFLEKLLVTVLCCFMFHCHRCLFWKGTCWRSVSCCCSILGAERS